MARTLKIIVVKMQRDLVQPYKDWGVKAPVILRSSHPQLQKGKRSSWPELQDAVYEGYFLEVIP